MIFFQSFHKFLVEQLLVMHTDVLASIVNLRKTIKELSAKTDKTVTPKQTMKRLNHLPGPDQNEMVALYSYHIRMMYIVVTVHS